MTRISDSLQQFLGDDGERIVYATRQHPIVIVGAAAKIILILVGTGLAFWLVPKLPYLEDGNPRKVAEVIVGLVGLGMLLTQVWRLLVWNAERLVVSTHKVLHVHGVISRDIASTPLVKVDELTVRQSVLGRMLKYGRLDVENAGGGKEPLHGLNAVPSPGHVYQLITDSARRERMIEGGARPEMMHPQQADAPTPEELAAEEAAAAEQRKRDVGTTSAE